MSWDAVFLGIVASIIVWWTFATRLVLGTRAALLTLAAMAGWLALTGYAAEAGWLDGGQVPPPFLRLMLPATVGVVLLSRSTWGRRVVEEVPLGWLVGFQAFRIVVELWLHAVWRAGRMPVQMTWSGRNFDVVTGVLAIFVAVLHRALGRWTVVAWNVLGLALLLNVVTIAVLSLPGRHVFPGMPNTLVLHAPYVWLPAVLVESALLGHLLVWRWLTRNKQRG